MFLNKTNLHPLSQEVTQQTRGKYLKNIRLHTPGGIGLDFGKGAYVMLYALPWCSALFMTETPPPKVPNSAWVMQLRKYLKGKKLIQIHHVAQDRVLCFDFGDIRLQWDVFGRHNRLYLIQKEHLLGQNRPGQAPSSGHVFVPIEPRDGLNHSKQQEQALFTVLDCRRFSRALGRLNQDLVKLQTRIADAESQLEKAIDDQSQRWGDLLQSAFGTLAKGATQARVIDYYSSNQSHVEIPLNPQLSLAQNIQKYYDKAKKSERTLTYWESHLPPLEKALETTQTRQTTLETAFSNWKANPQSSELYAILASELSPWMPALHSESKPKVVSRAAKFRQFTSKEGYLIWVGKGANENHALTFKHAKGNDLWFHLKDRPGPHVVVRLPKGQTLPQETLLDAATLACYFAKSTGDEVIYTHIKHLSPVKGAPGKAHVSKYKSVQLVLENARLERLLQKPKEAI